MLSSVRLWLIRSALVQTSMSICVNASQHLSGTPFKIPVSKTVSLLSFLLDIILMPQPVPAKSVMNGLLKALVSPHVARKSAKQDRMISRTAIANVPATLPGPISKMLATEIAQLS